MGFTFWLGVIIGILTNLATGLLLSTIFETLQRRRDLQRQLGELWLLATRASEAVNHSRLRRDKGAEAYQLWRALQDEWLRARHSLNFALSEEKREQIEDSISAIYELHILNSDKRNRKYLKVYPLTIGAKGGDGEEDVPTDYVDFGTWAAANGQLEEKAAYDDFEAYRSRLNQKVNAILHFNPFSKSAEGDVEPMSLPTELAQSWHFGYLFARVWKWFFAELALTFKEMMRPHR